MIRIDGKTVEDGIFGTKFACDISRCKGACCTVPGPHGAPLEPGEIPFVEENYPAVKKYLPKAHIRTIETMGLVRSDETGHYTSVHDFGPCVFVHYAENGEARCSFDTAYRKGEISWRKPISCHLFPIRLRGAEGTHLTFEYIPQCTSGFLNGEESNTTLVEFLTEPLERTFGKEWVAEFREAAQSASDKKRKE